MPIIGLGRVELTEGDADVPPKIQRIDVLTVAGTLVT
jgi:hypothetical protein